MRAAFEITQVVHPTVIVAPSTALCSCCCRGLRVSSKPGSGWRACCPNCGGKSHKVAIAEGENGTLLLTCFSCHNTAAVLAAIGMVMCELFVKRDLRNMTAAERSHLRQAALIPRIKAAIEVLHHEALVVLIAASKLGDGYALTGDELARMRVASLRVFDCSEVLA